MHKFSALLQCFLVEIIFVVAAIGQLLNSSDPCEWKGTDDACDKSQGLSCNYETSTCSCWDGRKIFSALQSRCVGKAGEECVAHEGERFCTENSYCSDDATLSGLPICMCNKDYFKSFNGSCQLKSKYGEFCSDFPEKRLCASEKGLKCTNYTCQCSFPEDQRYEPVTEMCISLAGGKCSKILNNCVENADCSDKLWGFDYETGDTKLIGYRCACKSGLKITDNGQCAVEYKGNCLKNSDCYAGEHMICLDGKCQCNPLSQIYERELKECVNLVGTKCKAVDSTPKCVANAKCNIYSETCKCVNGSSETPYKTCLLNYGQPCTPYKCNIFDGFACFNDTCQCYDSSLLYDEIKSVCASTTAQPCGKVKSAIVGYENIVDELYINCDSNSTCVQTTVNGKVKYVCLLGVQYPARQIALHPVNPS